MPAPRVDYLFPVFVEQALFSPEVELKGTCFGNAPPEENNYIHSGIMGKIEKM
jgi:hypothetical protein